MATLPQVIDKSPANAQPYKPYNTSFIKRKMEVHITLDVGEFEEGMNSKVFRDHGMTAYVEKLALPDEAKATIEILGMTMADMQYLTSLCPGGLALVNKKNWVSVYAGDDSRGLSQIYSGAIISAVADFSAAPEIKFRIQAETGIWGRTQAQGPNAIAGTQSAATFIEGQAKKAGYKFENQGVTSQLTDCIFNGSPLQQAYQAARQVGATLILDDGTFYLLNRGMARDPDSVPLITAETGLLGYPSISNNGIVCRCIYRPDLKFGGLVKIGSFVPKASGTWRIVQLSHKISANIPGNGDWESNFTAYWPGYSTEQGERGA